MSTQEVMIRAQRTPNPHAMKFIINQPLKKSGKVTYRSHDEAAGVAMVEDIFNLENIVQVFLFQNTMTVTHNGEWDGMNSKVLSSPS